MSAVRVPVLIVGAGAAGLATSALLAKHGISSLLVEKRREIFIYPKARNLSFRSLEILRGLGVGDQVRAVAEDIGVDAVKIGMLGDAATVAGQTITAVRPVQRRCRNGFSTSVYEMAEIAMARAMSMRFSSRESVWPAYRAAMIRIGQCHR